MKAIVVTCPNCGARLQVSDASSTVRCEYCETHAQIQRRTMFTRAPLPPQMPTMPRMPVAVQRGPNIGVMIGVGTGVTMALGMVLAIFLVKLPSRPSASQRAAWRAGAQEDIGKGNWQGAAPILVDVTGDGVPDIFGRSRRVTPKDQIRAILIDGATGKPRWESDVLGTYIDTYQSPLALAGDLALFAAQNGEVRAIEMASGKSRWSVKLPDRTERFCATASDVVAVGVDGVERPLQRATGQAGSAEAVAEAASPAPVEAKVPSRAKRRKAPPAKPRACASVPDDRLVERGFIPTSSGVNARYDLASAQIYEGPGGRVVSGGRARGTTVPTIVRIDAAGDALWRVEVPPDPLAAYAAPARAVVGDREVCAGYMLTAQSREAAHLTCFELADGKRRWDIAPGGGTERFQIVGRTLLLQNGGLELRDLETGALRWAY